MYGYKVAAWSASQWYPFLLPLELDADLAGGLGILYWWRLRGLTLRVRYRARAVNERDNDVSFDHTISLRRIASPALGDERDLVNPSVDWFFGAQTFGPEFEPLTKVVGAFLYLFPHPHAPDLQDSAIPYSYLVCGEALAPAFVLRVQLSEVGTGFGTYVTSYFHINAGRIGTGTLDGMTFDTYAEGPSIPFPWEVQQADVTLTRTDHFDHDGLYDTTTGLYAPGKKTNRYRGP